MKVKKIKSRLVKLLYTLKKYLTLIKKTRNKIFKLFLWAPYSELSTLMNSKVLIQKAERNNRSQRTPVSFL